MAITITDKKEPDIKPILIKSDKLPDWAIVKKPVIYQRLIDWNKIVPYTYKRTLRALRYIIDIYVVCYILHDILIVVRALII